MNSLKIFLALFLISIVGRGNANKIDPEDLIEQAEEDIDNDLRELMKLGARSKRFVHKKITPISQVMAKRNALFKRAQELLENDGMSKDEAIDVAYKALVQARSNHRRSKKGHPGGQSGTPPVTIVEDACLGELPDCTGESSNPFRRIDGTCNNLGGSSNGREVRRRGGGNGDRNGGGRNGSGRNGGGHGSHGGGHGGGNDGGNGGGNPPVGTEERSVWGSVSIKMRRLLHPNSLSYTDSLSTRTTLLSSTSNCPSGSGILPNARLVSHVFHTDDPNAEDNLATHMVTQMGQFLDHDITLTPEDHEENCCGSSISAPEGNCFPIEIPSDDSFYSAHNQNCLEFTRSTAYCEAEEAANGIVREQLNAITAFVDASNVYSSTDGDSGDDDQQESWDLRRRDGSGKLKVGANNLLPKFDAGVAIAGDVRAREMPGLATMHTLFLREHNRLCDILEQDSRTSGWGDEAYYQNARRILVAEWQNVIYGEYLPVVLGSEAMRDNGLELYKDSKYDNDEDPSITNSFATAAYRFGHSMIQGIIEMCSTTSAAVIRSYPLSENYFNLENYEYDNGSGMEQILMGLITQKAQKNDKFVSTETTDKLFAAPTQAFGTDLVARNIQRGRDHSLPGYVEFWKEFGRQRGDPRDINCWSDKPKAISQANWDLLKTLYEHPRQIDLFVGGMAEEPASSGSAGEAGLTGPTFNKIKALQFKALKNGDRYFFTHDNEAGSFSRNGQDTILGRKLADIICDNTSIEKVPTNVFKVVDGSNPYKLCTTKTPINLGSIILSDVTDPVGL